MNTYNIAPTQTKMVMDPALLASFQALSSTLRWRPLTLNLESCEEGGFLYFRITLRLSAEGPTYAGFSSGAPFMLTRDCKVKKKGFFLRHWVRQEAQDHKALPMSKLDYMQLAIVGETMLVRVHIDREMTLADTFKSVPFATWMFQVVQVDAAIEGAPGVRFAFAIERTVTPEEREIIQSNVEHTKEQIKKQRAASKLAANRVGPIRAPPRPLPVQPDRNRIIKLQTTQGRPTTAAKTPAIARKPQTTRVRQQPQSNMRYIPSVTGIVARTLHPQNAVPISAVPLAPHPPPSVPVSSGRSIPQATTKGNYANGRSNNSHANAAAASANNPTVEKRLNHPYLKLWEKRALDDPYEPFFIVDSDEMKSKMNVALRVEDSSNASLQFNYKRLQSLPGANYPSYFHDAPDANYRPDTGNDLLILYPAKKIKTMTVGDKHSQAKESGKSNGVDAKMDLGIESKQEVSEKQDDGGGKANKNHEKVVEKEQVKDKVTETPEKESVPGTASLGKPDGDDDAKRANDAPKNAIEMQIENDAGVKVVPPEASMNELTQAMDVKNLTSVNQTSPSGAGEVLQHNADGMSIDKPGTGVEDDIEMKPTEDAEKALETQNKQEPQKRAIPENLDAKEDKNSIENEPGKLLGNVGGGVKEVAVVRETEKELEVPQNGLTVKPPENEPEKQPEPTVQVSSEEKSVDPRQASHIECVAKELEIDGANGQGEVVETSESELYTSYEYIAAVKAAADYNANLTVDRAALQSWLVEDRRLGEDNDGSKDDDDNESSSSE